MKNKTYFYSTDKDFEKMLKCERKPCKFEMLVRFEEWLSKIKGESYE